MLIFKSYLSIAKCREMVAFKYNQTLRKVSRKHADSVDRCSKDVARYRKTITHQKSYRSSSSSSSSSSSCCCSSSSKVDRKHSDSFDRFSRNIARYRKIIIHRNKYYFKIQVNKIKHERLHSVNYSFQCDGQIWKRSYSLEITLESAK